MTGEWLTSNPYCKLNFSNYNLIVFVAYVFKIITIDTRICRTGLDKLILSIFLHIVEMSIFFVFTRPAEIVRDYKSMIIWGIDPFTFNLIA